jgi:hypothetical protein
MRGFIFLLCVLGGCCFTLGAGFTSAPKDATLPNVASTLEASITCAIASRTVIAFTYHGTARTVQPHRLGISKALAHKILLRAYELTKDGFPSNTWKLYDLSKLSNLTLTPTTFPKNAPGYTPTDKALSSPLAEVPYVETTK